MTMRAQTGEVPRILDLSRTIARGARRAATGIDRAEKAYFNWLLGQQSAVFGLIRTEAGFLLLDRDGLTALKRAISNPDELYRADLLSWITHRRNPERARLETHARKLAVARSSQNGLGRMLQRNLPSGVEYVNVGHSNLTKRVLRAFSRCPDAFSTVALHDLLPLTHPQFCRAAAVQKAERIAQTISADADRVIHISESARASNEKLLTRLGRCPPGVVAPLGVRTPQESHPQSTRIKQPYFLAIGTLEPRKNLGFLLDLWDALAELADLELPTLVLAGARGWECDAFYERLTGHQLFGAKICWIESPEDSEVDNLLLGAHGLLFPSHAEGQGLPPLEAASVGAPVVCQPLPSLKELLGGYPTYVRCDDLAGWTIKIRDLLAEQSPRRLTVPNTLPTWESHFAMVFDGETSLAAGG